MKTVFTNSEIFDHFGKQDHGKNGKGSLSFHGNIAYSYAAKIGGLRKNGRVLLITTRRYSITTSGHINRLACSAAASRASRCIEVENPDPYTAENYFENLKGIAANIRGRLQIARRRHKPDNFNWDIERIKDRWDDFQAYVAWFKTELREYKAEVRKLTREMEELAGNPYYAQKSQAEIDAYYVVLDQQRQALRRRRYVERVAKTLIESGR